MPKITNWTRESRTPTLAYRNTDTQARAVLTRAPDTYRYKWWAAILVEGYPVWVRGFDTKDTKTFRDELRERVAPTLVCPDCGHENVTVDEKSAAVDAVERWFDCPECGYGSPPRVIYEPGP